MYLEQVAEHVGGYDEWTVDITDAAAQAAKANKGSVPVAVWCDNSRDLEMIPSTPERFQSLRRSVSLRQPGLRPGDFAGARARRNEGGTRRKSLGGRPRAALQSGDSEGPRRSRDRGSGSARQSHPHIESPAGTATNFSFAIDKAQLWSPEKPQLYRCNVTMKSAAGETSADERFGLRYFEWVDHGPFKLNGERLLLRGTHRHEDHAGLAAAMTEDLIRKEMHMIKDMGANFMRLAHIQQSPIVLDLCDELGFLVWEEIPWCRGGIGGDRYEEQARRMLRNMIDQHYNHPSIILWGLGNEPASSRRS